MKTLNDLTPEIIARIPMYKDRCMDTSGTIESSRKYIEKIYELGGLEKPIVVFAKNPNEYKILFESIPKALKNNSTDFQRHITPDIEKEVNSDKSRSRWSWYCSIYSRVYLTWYKFIQDEFQIDHPLKDTLNELYELSMDSVISRCWFTEQYVLVLETPQNLKFENDVLHNAYGPSYTYDNGEMGFYVRGMRLDKEIFDAITNKTYTAEEFFRLDNEEVKSGCIALMQELFGDTFVFDFFKKVMDEVDTYTDIKDEEFLEGTTNGMNIGVYTLFKGKINDESISYVRCFCPSTDRMFFLGVEPKYNTAKDAIASLYRIPKELKSEIKEIRRQGERFSTIFTDKGKKLLAKLSQTDIQDTTTISGDEYFSKLTYEY